MSIYGMRNLSYCLGIAENSLGKQQWASLMKIASIYKAKKCMFDDKMYNCAERKQALIPS